MTLLALSVQGPALLAFEILLTGVTLVSSAPGVVVVLNQNFFHSFSLFVLLL